MIRETFLVEPHATLFLSSTTNLQAKMVTSIIYRRRCNSEICGGLFTIHGRYCMYMHCVGSDMNAMMAVHNSYKHAQVIQFSLSKLVTLFR